MSFQIISDINVIGAVPQANCLGYFDEDEPIKNIDWICPDFKVTPKGKVTDWIYHNLNYYGSLISDNFFSILKDFKIGDHKMYKVALVKNGRKYEQYHYIHFIKNKKYYDYVDWDKTVMHKYFKHTEKLEPIRFSNYQELMKMHESLIWTDYQLGGEVILKEVDFDFYKFKIPFFPMDPVCSESCKLALEQSNLTGFKFEPLNSGD